LNEKDIDSIRHTRLWASALRFTAVFAPIGWFAANIPGLLVALPASIGAAFITEVLLGIFGGGSVNLQYGMGRRDRSLRDQFTGTLNQARFR